jgi:hypothetical protein
MYHSTICRCIVLGTDSDVKRLMLPSAHRPQPRDLLLLDTEILTVLPHVSKIHVSGDVTSCHFGDAHWLDALPENKESNYIKCQI